MMVAEDNNASNSSISNRRSKSRTTKGIVMAFFIVTVLVNLLETRSPSSIINGNVQLGRQISMEEEELASLRKRVLEDLEKKKRELMQEERSLHDLARRLEEKEKQLGDREAALRTKEAIVSTDTNTDIVNKAEEQHNRDSTKSKVMIQQKYARIDRLGNFIQRPLYLMGYAHCYGHDFCIKPGSEGFAKYFGFPTCPEDVSVRYPIRESLSFKGTSQSSFNLLPGLYWMNQNDEDLANWVHQHAENMECAFDETFRSKWRDMIINASYHDQIGDKDVARQDLFQKKDPNTVTVAVNMRRGDFVDWGRKPIPDEFYVVMLRKLRYILKKAGKKPKVHLFSEDYGMIDKERNIKPNWGLYKGLVDHFHLAPDLRTSEPGRGAHVMDMALNLRDWRHFVKADILVVGGTFSRIPAMGRPEKPDPKTGLPLTIFPCVNGLDGCGNKPSYAYGWTKHSFGALPDKLSLVNLPPNFAQFDDPKVDHVGDLIMNFYATYYHGPLANKSEDKSEDPATTSNAASSSSEVEKKIVRQDVSLVTSFFADGVLTLTNATKSASPKAHHLHEIAAAILKNIHNPYFAQVVVILDGSRDEANCDLFRHYLGYMGNRLLEWNRQHTANIKVRVRSLQKLTCVNREEGQPNYYEMFQYATTSQIVTSPIVILENADQVFDDTLYWAGLIKPNALLTLPTHGYNKNVTPPVVTSYFQFANRMLPDPIDWDNLHKKIWPYCPWRGQAISWDGYIFHREYVQGTLQPSDFKRPTNKHSTAFFNMNEMGAENAALFSLLKNLPDSTHSAPGCSVIKTWHFHAAPKMHTSSRVRGFGWTPRISRVPDPWANTRFLRADDAFVVDPKTSQAL